MNTNTSAVNVQPSLKSKHEVAVIVGRPSDHLVTRQLNVIDDVQEVEVEIKSAFSKYVNIY